MLPLVVLPNIANSWSETPIAQRVQVINRIADLIEANLEELATLESQDQGKACMDKMSYCFTNHLMFVIIFR